MTWVHLTRVAHDVVEDEAILGPFEDVQFTYAWLRDQDGNEIACLKDQGWHVVVESTRSGWKLSSRGPFSDLTFHQNRPVSRLTKPPMTVCIVERPPDSSNEFTAFEHSGVHVHFVNVDYGRADLRDAEEFKEWADSLRADAEELWSWRQEPACLASMRLAQIIKDTAESFGHTVEWDIDDDFSKVVL